MRIICAALSSTHTVRVRIPTAADEMREFQMIVDTLVDTGCTIMTVWDAYCATCHKTFHHALSVWDNVDHVAVGLIHILVDEDFG
jgi:hypothetical protein